MNADPSIHGRRLGKALCEALNLNPNDVQHIVIDAACNDAATITVQFLVKQSESDAIGEVLQQFELIEKGERR